MFGMHRYQYEYRILVPIQEKKSQYRILVSIFQYCTDTCRRFKRSLINRFLFFTPFLPKVLSHLMIRLHVGSSPHLYNLSLSCDQDYLLCKSPKICVEWFSIFNHWSQTLRDTAIPVSSLKRGWWNQPLPVLFPKKKQTCRSRLNFFV